MSRVIRYEPDDVLRAFDRFKAVTGASRTEFLTWLGYQPWAMREFPEGTFISVSVSKYTHVYRNMEMLLNQHWYALLKAHLVREPVE